MKTKLRLKFAARDIFLRTEITKKMRPCSRIYYSNVFQLLNMFRATHRSSSGAQKTVIAASGTYVKPEAAITVFELLMMSGVSLETC
jgi:hypothetical protein